MARYTRHMRRDFLEIDTTFAAASRELPVHLQDVEAIRLLLSGSSVIDWQRLAFRDLDEVDRYLQLLLIDVADAGDRLRLRYVYNEAVSYLEEHLHLRFPPELRDPDDVRQVFLWASEYGRFRRTQILSCVVLKLMHVIHHMEAADLKFKTAISEEQFLELAQTRILDAAREMQEAGLPVISFYGSRKSRSSIITKLLAKRETVAATIFDKLRFRIVVERPDDLAPSLAWITRHVIPFNYVLPGQSHNNLLDPHSLLAWLPEPEKEAAQVLSDAPAIVDTGKNEFSGRSYRMINFIVDYPVPVPEAQRAGFSFELGKTVFVMVEFQILDEETAALNEEGENAHNQYKDRQHRVVARRLKRGGRRD